jgi:PEP-CTERM motif
MNISHSVRVLQIGLVMQLAMVVLSQDSYAINVYFDGSTSTDFLDATNWTPEHAPGSNLFDTYGIDDGLSATMSSGSPIINALRVGSVDKTHSTGPTHFGRLTISGGTLGVIGVNSLSIGRENPLYYPVSGDYNEDTVVDAADYTIWRDTLGSMTDLRADGDNSGTIDAPDFTYWKSQFGKAVRGGELDLTGSSTLNSNGLLVGERTKGLLSIGPSAVVNVRIWDTTVTPNQFGGTEDMRIGGYGPAYDDGGSEPGLNGNGLVDVQGTLNAKDLYVSEHGATGEIRLSGAGKVTLNGSLHMDFCGGCVSDAATLAKRSSKISIVGSGGTFAVGQDPDSLVVDPTPPPRDLLAASATAILSFTADSGGVTPIVVTQNVLPEPSGTAYINGANLLLNLDAYTSATPLTLIQAPPLQLVGTFGSVTFLGSRSATVNYDVANGKVFLNNFHLGPGAAAGSLVGGAVPEPSTFSMLGLGLFLFTLCAEVKRREAGVRGLQCLKIRA